MLTSVVGENSWFGGVSPSLQSCLVGAEVGVVSSFSHLPFGAPHFSPKELFSLISQITTGLCLLN